MLQADMRKRFAISSAKPTLTSPVVFPPTTIPAIHAVTNTNRKPTATTPLCSREVLPQPPLVALAHLCHLLSLAWQRPQRTRGIAHGSVRPGCRYQMFRPTIRNGALATSSRASSLVCSSHLLVALTSISTISIT